ncbi:MAG: TrkA family potassium uptake protein [Natrialbaceae archaeon]|nr:TrkA family potassium uptake protein [Natrialbaceae archaeon]
MEFVIVGYGRVGSRTARILGEEGYTVTVVDVDQKRLERAASQGFHTEQGTGDDEAVLTAAGIETADAIAALTPDLTVNYAACMVGAEYGCRTVLRIDEDYREDIYTRYAEAVDEVIYPERLGAAGAKTALLGGTFGVVGDLAKNLRLSLVVLDPSSPAVGKRVSDLELPTGVRVYAHGAAGEPLDIPIPGTTLEAGDEVAIVAEVKSFEAAKQALRGG